MTLVLTLGNRDQVIQISDRRLTVNGRLQDDESSKGGVFICANARLAFGYTGLARSGEFQTQQWLVSALAKCAPPDYHANNILERLKAQATLDFNTQPSLRRVSRSNKRLSIIFSGYLYDYVPPLAVFAILTNFQSFVTGKDNSVARDSFEIRYWAEKRPLYDELSLVQRIGFWPAMNSQDVSTLRTFLIERKPAEAILGKAIEVFHIIADRPQAQGTIGKQLSSVLIPRDLATSVKTDYHSNVSTHEVFIPEIIFAVNEQRLSTILNASVQPVDPDNTLPMAVPKVRRNAPCPCNSGKKYKRCHGLRR